jgi:hypothetical protein
MRKKVGLIWILSAIVLFAVNFFTFGNQSLFAGRWATVVSGIIGFAICPISLLVGVSMLILGKKDKK